jgi:hypothetical protein
MGRGLQASPIIRLAMDLHTAKAFSREEPRIELIQALLESVLPLVELECEGRPVRVDGFRLRDPEQWRTANELSLQQNLGSLSTACNCHCSFCYEDGNPPGLFERRPTYVTLQEAHARLRLLHDGKGMARESKEFFEPLCNPRFLELMELIRRQDPRYVIDVTTNGVGLTDEVIERLAELSPVYVNISLNSADDDIRRDVMRYGRDASAARSVELLRASGIPFMGTVVPWPQQGVDDVRNTLRFLDAHEARIIRVSLPGLSRHHAEYRPGLLTTWVEQVLACVEELRAELSTPILPSPFAHVSAAIDPVVEGVIRRSPAAVAGVRTGDLLTAIDGVPVVSRSHASSLLKKALRAGAADVELLRDGQAVAVSLREVEADADAYPYKPRSYRPFDFHGLTFGLCLPQGFHLQYLKQIHDHVTSTGARRTVIIASAFYRDLVASLVAELPLPEGAEYEVLVPPNEFFGGTVNVGDLWVLDDIIAAVEAHVAAHGKPDLLLLPDTFLSHWGRDLRNVPYTELGVRLGIPVALIACDRIML